jgi:hypothetical protein
MAAASDTSLGRRPWWRGDGYVDISVGTGTVASWHVHSFEP